MDDKNKSATSASDLRRDIRVPIDDEVTIEIAPQNIVGPDKNVSAQGVYFTTTASVRVNVRIAGQSASVPGELVRVESMGDGTIGIAVRFRQ